MTSSFIEKLARAAQQAALEYDSAAPDYGQLIVRAILTAMREPDEGMLAVRVYSVGKAADDPSVAVTYVRASGDLEVWQAMIDKALEE